MQIGRLPNAVVVGITALLAACASTDRLAGPIDESVPSFAAGGGGTCVLANGNTAATGFDKVTGYNRCARIFNGLFGGASAYANDKLQMK